MQPGRAWGAGCREGDLALPGLAPEDPGVPLTPPTSDRSFQDSPTTRGQGTGRQRPDGAGDLGSKALAGPPAWGAVLSLSWTFAPVSSWQRPRCCRAHTARARGRGAPTHRCPPDPRSGPTGTSAPRPGSRAAPGFPPARFRAGWTAAPPPRVDTPSVWTATPLAAQPRPSPLDLGQRPWLHASPPAAQLGTRLAWPEGARLGKGAGAVGGHQS